MVKGISIWIDGVHYASSGKTAEALALIESIFQDRRHDFLSVQILTVDREGSQRPAQAAPFGLQAMGHRGRAP